ncbi:transposase [Vibrio sp. PP-XX7]
MVIIFYDIDKPMTTARSQQVCPELTPYYHCVSRRVRRSFLCGNDPYSGQSYEHRREWVESRILALATIYCIRICAYAVMSNHYHLVACIDKEAALSLSDHDVIERWCTEHQMPWLIQRFLSGQLSSKAELDTCTQLIETWRHRLYSLSWLMKELNYEIAVQANQEDQCTGRFWEGRFKSQALLDEKALLAAMAYVDLESGQSTSRRHTRAIRPYFHQSPPDDAGARKNRDSRAGQLYGIRSAKISSMVSLSRLMDYIELVDWVGRQIRPDKQGHIDERLPDILTRLSLSQQDCLTLCTELEKKPRIWIGSSERLPFRQTLPQTTADGGNSHFVIRLLQCPEPIQSLRSTLNPNLPLIYAEKPHFSWFDSELNKSRRFQERFLRMTLVF